MGAQTTGDRHASEEQQVGKGPPTNSSRSIPNSPDTTNMVLATASIDDPETWHLFANLDPEFSKVILSLL
jgi:hypothetical protein